MTRTFTFNSASLNTPWAIGFDSLWDRFHTIESVNSASNYPPYNIVKHDAEHWSIELAVAGFKRNELDVELAEGVLTISAKTETSETRKWTLADDVVVRDASLVDGVLTIDLERIVPEDKKPRKIDIL